MTGGSNFAGFMKCVESLVEEDFITFLKAQLEKVLGICQCLPAHRSCRGSVLAAEDVQVLKLCLKIVWLVVNP